MKFLFVTVLSILFTVGLSAQKKGTASVQKAVEQLSKAMISGKADELNAIVSDQLGYGHSSGLVEGKAEFMDKFLTGKTDFVTIDLSEQTIDIKGKSAIVRHILNAKNNDNGVPGTVKLKVLLVFHKEKGQWKLWARQAVKLT